MTISHFENPKNRVLGMLGAALLIVGFLVFLMFRSSNEVKRDQTHDLFNAFGVTWEMRDVEWREAEGLHSIELRAQQLRGGGKLPGSIAEIGDALCGAVLSALPRGAPVKHRNNVFRVRVFLPPLKETGVSPEFVSNVVDGACKSIEMSGRSMLSYPGLAPDWVLLEWKADNADLEGFQVVFRRTSDVKLAALDLDFACRAALFDLPGILGEHAEAFRRLRSIRVVAETGVGLNLFRFSRSLAWDVPISPAGCGQAKEVEL